MTRKEATKWFLDHMPTRITPVARKAYLLAISALHPITREQVEKIYPGCDECKPSCRICINTWVWDSHGKPQVCEDCKEYSNFEADDNYCYNCGAPMTDEAVQMVMERLGELYEKAD